MKAMDVGKVFKDVVQQASKQDRVTTGVYSCAKLLQTWVLILFKSIFAHRYEDCTTRAK